MSFFYILTHDELDRLFQKYLPISKLVLPLFHSIYNIHRKKFHKCYSSEQYELYRDGFRKSPLQWRTQGGEGVPLRTNIPWGGVQVRKKLDRDFGQKFITALPFENIVLQFNTKI